MKQPKHEHVFRNFFKEDYLKTFIEVDLTDMVMQCFTVVLIILIGMFALKTMGKKSIAQLTLPSTLFLFLYANTLGALIVTPEHVIIAVILTIVILLAVLALEKAALKFGKFEKLIVGIPDIVYKNEEFIRAELRANKISADQIETLVRIKGVPSLQAAKRIILEPNGQISVEVKPEFEPVKKYEFEHAMKMILEQLNAKYEPAPDPGLENLFVEADKRKNAKQKQPELE